MKAVHDAVLANEAYDTPAEQSDPAEYDVKAVFRVSDDHTANWVVWRIVAARIRAERAAAFAAAESNRAEREEKLFLARFGAELEQFAREKLARMKGRGAALHRGGPPEQR
jgi:hypothetical protein